MEESLGVTTNRGASMTTLSRKVEPQPSSDLTWEEDDLESMGRDYDLSELGTSEEHIEEHIEDSDHDGTWVDEDENEDAEIVSNDKHEKRALRERKHRPNYRVRLQLSPLGKKHFVLGPMSGLIECNLKAMARAGLGLPTTMELAWILAKEKQNRWPFSECETIIEEWKFGKKRFEGKKPGQMLLDELWPKDTSSEGLKDDERTDATSQNWSIGKELIEKLACMVNPSARPDVVDVDALPDDLPLKSALKPGSNDKRSVKFAPIFREPEQPQVPSSATKTNAISPIKKRQSPFISDIQPALSKVPKIGNVRSVRDVDKLKDLVERYQAQYWSCTVTDPERRITDIQEALEVVGLGDKWSRSELYELIFRFRKGLEEAERVFR